MHAQRAGGIGARAHQAAVESAGAHRDGGGGIAADLAGDIDRGAASDGAVDAAVGHRNGAFHDHQVLAFFLFHHAVEHLDRRVRRARHDDFVILPGKEIEDDVGDFRMARSKHRLRASRAVLKLQPDQHRLSRLCRRRRRSARDSARAWPACASVALQNFTSWRRVMPRLLSALARSYSLRAFRTSRQTGMLRSCRRSSFSRPSWSSQSSHWSKPAPVMAEASMISISG